MYNNYRNANNRGNCNCGNNNNNCNNNCNNNYNNNCGCNNNGYEEIIREVKEAIITIRDGICLVNEGVRFYANGDCICGKEAISEGLCCIIRGYEELLKVLERICITNPEAKRLIECGLREIAAGIEEIEKGFECIIVYGNCAQGTRIICRGIRCVEEGLCNVLRGLECLR